jgi:hypothetical protein
MGIEAKALIMASQPDMMNVLRVNGTLLGEMRDPKMLLNSTEFYAARQAQPFGKSKKALQEKKSDHGDTDGQLAGHSQCHSYHSAQPCPAGLIKGAL